MQMQSTVDISPDKLHTFCFHTTIYMYMILTPEHRVYGICNN